MQDVPPSDNTALLPSNGNIITDHEHPRLAQSFGPKLLGGQAKVERITRVVHDDHQSALFARNEVQTPADLGDIGRRKDVAGHCCREQTLADEAGMGGLVARSTAREEGNAGFVRRAIDHCLSAKRPCSLRSDGWTHPVLLRPA